MTWQEKREVKKGNLGEKYAHEFLEKNGFIVYKPITEGAHKIDYFAHSGKQKQVIAIDAKTKKRMACKPETGFNYNNYLHYIEIQQRHHIPAFVYFIDEFEECIYGQWLTKLSEGRRIKDVIVWPLSEMKLIRWLSRDEIEELKRYNGEEKYNYTNVKRFFTKQLSI